MDKGTFLVGYGKVISRSWEDATYRDELLANPREVLASAGIITPEGSQIKLIESTPPADGDPNTQLSLWEQGESSGVYTLLVPNKPTGFDPNDVVLSEELLGMVSGGTAEETAAGCCCCPCCCCFTIEA